MFSSILALALCVPGSPSETSTDHQTKVAAKAPCGIPGCTCGCQDGGSCTCVAKADKAKEGCDDCCCKVSVAVKGKHLIVTVCNGKSCKRHRFLLRKLGVTRFQGRMYAPVRNGCSSCGH